MTKAQQPDESEDIRAIRLLDKQLQTALDRYTATWDKAIKDPTPENQKAAERARLRYNSLQRTIDKLQKSRNNGSNPD